MAQGLMNLSNLLGQSSNATQGGLMGGGVFSQPMSRGQRRSKLLTDAISGAGANPYARLGASFGGLIGMGARAGAEGLGIVDKPQEVQRAEAIRQVQDEVRQQGLDPMENPAQFGEVVSKRFQELGFNDLALKTQAQVQQMMPEQKGTSRVVSGDSETGQQIGLSPGESAVVELGPDGTVSNIKDRTQSEPEEAPAVTNQRMVNLDSGRRAVVGTLNNRLVEVTDQGPVPLQENFASEKEEGVRVLGSGRFRNRDTGETYNLVRTNKGLARQTVGADGQPTYSYVNSSDYESIGARETADRGGFGDVTKQARDFRFSVDSFARRAQRLNEQLSEENLGVPGAIARFGAEFGANITGIIRQATGVDIDPEVNKTDAYSATFDELGLANSSAQIKSGLVSAAIMKAYAMQGGQGELRKNEVERAMRTLRVNGSDPDQIKAVLGQTSRQLIEDFNAFREIEARTSGTDNYALPPLKSSEYNLPNTSTTETGGNNGGGEQTQSEITANAIRGMSIQQLRNLDQDDPAFNDPDVVMALQDRLAELRGSPTATAPDRNQRQRGGAR